ncbi:MAG: zinc ABC transporter substrate-binding protein, partial [Sandaracinus sp.]|nr:zinc ABC transporter substrate-binding protein [Sandaracinus sp.]
TSLRAGVLALVLLGTGCGGAEASPSKPTVAVSIFPIYDVVQRIAGERFEVICVLPPGRTEHSYDPTPREVAALADTDLALAVGLELDGWLQRIVQNAAGDVRTVELGPALEPRRFTPAEIGVIGGHDHGDHDHHHGSHDPHFWLDPVRMADSVDAIVEALATLDPSASDELRQRGDAEKAKLRELHQAIETASQRWRRRDIVTFHGSFGYFAERYGLRVVAVVEPQPGREPTPRYVEEVVGALRGAESAALFYEPQLDARPARIVAREAGRPIFELDPIGGTEGRTSYEALLLHDVAVLDEALR